MASKAQLTGMRGVYLVAAELTRLGFIASPTSRSADGADLLVTDQMCTTAFSVQVKTNATSFSYFLVGKSGTRMISRTHIYVLVNIKPQETEYYVVPSSKLERHIKTFKRRNSVWYGVPSKDIQKFKGRWDAFSDPK